MVFPRIQPNPECREGFYNGTVAGPNTELAIQENIPDAGLVGGDRIVTVGSSNVSSLSRPAWDEIWSSASEIHLTVLRGGNRIEIPVATNFKTQIESSIGQTSFFQCRDQSGNIFDVNVYGVNNSAFVRVNQNDWRNLNVNSNYPIRVGIYGTAPSLHQDLPVSEAQIPLSRGFIARGLTYAGYSATASSSRLPAGPVLGLGFLLGYRWSQNGTIHNRAFAHYAFTEGSVAVRGVMENFDLSSQNRQFISLELEANRTFLINNDLRLYWHINPIGAFSVLYNEFSRPPDYDSIASRNPEVGVLLGFLMGLAGAGAAAGVGPGVNIQLGVRLNNFSDPQFYFQSSIAQIGIEIYRRVRFQADANMIFTYANRSDGSPQAEYPVRLSVIGGF